MHMRRLIIVVAAGALLLVAATSVLAAPTGAGSTTTVQSAVGLAGDVLSDVLDGLVSAGTINQAQADAIEKAVDDRRAELQAEREKLREQMQTFLEDGQLTTDELRALRGAGGFGHRGGFHGAAPDDGDSSSGSDGSDGTSPSVTPSGTQS
jgi:polyhydroxyalkanoate synthesis regulator phasin